MPATWNQISTVGEDGRIEIIVPELKPGDKVKISVERESDAEGTPQATAGKREMGFLKGKIWMADDFDAPLDDFADYM